MDRNPNDQPEEDKFLLPWETPLLLRLNQLFTESGTVYQCVEEHYTMGGGCGCGSTYLSYPTES